MVQWVVRSILHGGPIELFLVTASAPRLWYVPSCLWDGAYKRTLATNLKNPLPATNPGWTALLYPPVQVDPPSPFLFLSQTEEQYMCL